jgi:hypothetical protein
MELFAELLSSSEAAAVAGPDHKPRSLSEVDVRQQVLEDLALKTLFLSGPFSVYQLAEQIHLSFEIATELFTRLREQQLCQVTGMRGNVPMMAITTQGRGRALELLSQNH